jgi:hypothetical protein
VKLASIPQSDWPVANAIATKLAELAERNVEPPTHALVHASKLVGCCEILGLRVLHSSHVTPDAVVLFRHIDRSLLIPMPAEMTNAPDLWRPGAR